MEMRRRLGNARQSRTYIFIGDSTGELDSLVSVIPDTVEPEYLFVMVQELSEGVQFLIWSQRLHRFQHLRTETKTGIGANIYVHMHVHMYAPIYVHTHICMYVYMYNYKLYTHTYVCKHNYIRISTYT